MTWAGMRVGPEWLGLGEMRLGESVELTEKILKLPCHGGHRPWGMPLRLFL